MYEIDEETGAYIFTHNPFSMPQEADCRLCWRKSQPKYLLINTILFATGVELSSGAVRNHDLPTMIKAFEIAGYTEEKIEESFPALYNRIQIRSTTARRYGSWH